MSRLQPFTVEFSRWGALLLPLLGTLAWQDGIQPVWLRLLAGRLHSHSGQLRYLAVTEAAPLSESLVLAENKSGEALATLSWDHPNVGEWKIQQWGAPPSSSPEVWQWTSEETPKPLFAKFTVAELESVLTLISKVDETPEVLGVAA